MIIASGNMQMSSRRSCSQAVEISTSTKLTAAGAAAASGGATSTSRQIVSHSGSVSSGFQSTSYSVPGDSEDNALPSENYLQTRYSGSTDNAVSRDSDAQYSIRKYLFEYIETLWEMMLSRLSGHRSSGISSLSGGRSLSAGVLNLTTGSGNYTTWLREDTAQVSYTETEATSFSAKGTVITADGRSISIDVQLNMSRSFTETLSCYSSSIQTILTDPLVIQLGSSPVSVSDEKFSFDIDCDGVTEQISKLSVGSAFLALDKNGDGIINDGSELFGTKSGNGFADLAAYDEDGNGWIDENDSIYYQLKLWQKDDAGNDKLTSLSEQGIGAIYLGSQSTKFSLNSLEDNSTNGVITRTGVYLTEDGQAKTISQVDLAVS